MCCGSRVRLERSGYRLRSPSPRTKRRRVTRVIDGDTLEEGATVTVLVPELDETFELTPGEETALEESLKQAAAEQFVDADTLLRELRQ